MTISRKEFFRQGLFSLGRAALDVRDALQAKPAATDPVLMEETAVAPEPRPDMVAESFNERCLARSCGCFACVERCEPQAILLVPGEGIRIDRERCCGCGMCEYVCPVAPKAVALAPRAV